MAKSLILLFIFTLLLAACSPLGTPSTVTLIPIQSESPLAITTATILSSAAMISTPTSTSTTVVTITSAPTTTATPTLRLTATPALPTQPATRMSTITPTSRPTATPIPTTPGPDFSNLGSGKVVFSSQHYNPAAEISIVNLKTGRIMRLIGNLFANNLGPRLSPDGKKVIFSSFFNGNYEIFRLMVDEKTLANFPEDLEQTLEAMEWLEKLDITQLTQTEYDEIDPTWSPDGNFIAYTAMINNTQNLIVLPLGGGQPVQVSQNLWISNPDFSPDGQKIVFEDATDGGGSDIAWIPVGGGSRRKLTNILWTSERSPVWSPDGAKIAYCAVYEGQSEIAVMNADGSQVKRLTNHPAEDCEPSWSLDGKQIIFNSKRDGFSNLYVLDADGGNVRQLTFFNRKNTALSADWGK